MNDIELEQNLKKSYQQLYGDPPVAEDIWRQIAPRLAKQEQNTSWWRRFLTAKQHNDGQFTLVHHKQFVRRPIQRIGIALVALVMGLTVIAATSYAATGGGLFSGLFSFMGVKPIAPNFSDYHQSKSIDGYTLTIQNAYADANRVLVGYTGEAPVGGSLINKFFLAESKLTTEQGVELQNIGGVSLAQRSSDTLLDFDASNIQGTPKELHLHLTIPYGSQPPSSAFHIDGTLTFNFAIPFHPANIVNVNHSVTASGKSVIEQSVFTEMGQKVKSPIVTLNGRTVTLKQVVISPSEVRTYIKGFTSTSEEGASNIFFKMTVNGRIYDYHMLSERSDVWQVKFDDASLASQKGMWTLTIQQRIPRVNPKTGKPYIEIAATWTFQFTVK